jgi:tetratricopeptide (TPR) repeat protein
MRLVLPTTMAAASLLVCLASCARDPVVAGEVVVLDERLTLVRGETLDTLMREVIAPADGTCVAILEEDDVDVSLELQAATNGAAPSKVEVESGQYGEGIEVAAIPVARGAKVSIHLSTVPDMPAPTRVQTRIVCYDAAAQSPVTLARVAAYRAWSEATLSGATSSDESVTRSRELMDVAIAKFRSAGGDARMAAWALLIKGSVLNNSMEHLHTALPELQAAEKAFAGLKEPRNAARARFNIGVVYNHMMNDGTSKNPTPEEAKVHARKIFTDMAAESSALGQVEKARAVYFLGVNCFELADYACATRHFAAAADLSHAAGHRSDELNTLHNLAVTEMDLGNFANSVRYFDRVVPLIEKDPAGERYMVYHFNAGMAYANFGDTSRAIKHLLMAQESARKRQSASELGRAMFGLGFTYWLRGDVQQAETFFTESLAQRRKASDASGIILSLNIVGRLARQQGRFDEARSLHREALERSATPGMKLHSNYELAQDHAAAGQFDRAIATCRAGLAIDPSGNSLKRTQMEVLLARYLVAHQPTAAALDEAERLARAALKLALENSDTVLEVSARHVLAKVLAARGNRVDAKREYESAIAVILDFRGSTASPELQASTVAYEQETFREYVDLQLRDAVARGAGRFAPASRDEEDALRVLELARSTSSSAARDVRLDAATQARIDALLQQMAAKRVRLAQINNSSSPGGKTLELLQLEMSNLRAEVDRLRGGSVDDTRSTKLPGSVNRPWPAVTTGVTQLSYAVGKRNAYLWARDADGLRVTALAESPVRLERALASFGKINQVRSAAMLEQALAELSAGLLPPGTLAEGSTSLEVVADGALGTLPFAALHLPGSGKRVVETHAVRMISSMFDGSAALSGKPRAMALLGIASNIGSLRSAAHVFPSLGGARAEARAIADLFTQDNGAAQIRLLTAADGDEQTIRTLWTGGADAVHFATHGLANLRYPSASLLLLPKGGGQEAAYLTAGQVQEWRGDVGLVFLAACETAAGPARFAEGMSGLPRSFLTAGARGIVATLWPVEDVYESEFSVEFYRRFIAGRDAESALAETQREWLKPRPAESAANHQQRLATAWAHVFHARPKSR